MTANPLSITAASATAMIDLTVFMCLLFIGPKLVRTSIETYYSYTRDRLVFSNVSDYDIEK
jgi:hypothetical protein